MLFFVELGRVKLTMDGGFVGFTPESFPSTGMEMGGRGIGVERCTVCSCAVIRRGHLVDVVWWRRWGGARCVGGDEGGTGSFAF